MLFATLVVVVCLLTAIHDSHQHLEETVERRTAALHAEINERKRLEQAKLQAERLAVAGAMAAQVAHEIRNPLGAIALNLDRVREEFDALASGRTCSTGDADALLQEMNHQLWSIRNVLKAYLKFARLPKSNRSEFEVNDWIERKLRFLQPTFDQQHVRLERHLAPHLPAICADPEQLWEVVLNLIRNSLDAMSDGGQLTVESRQAGPEILICVRDTGKGMTQQEVANLFVPFFSTKSDGTGLGLAHAQQIVIEHGGRIEFATAPNKGSSFTIHLPISAGTTS
jgi:signal transduction histidine kinase